MDSCVQLQMKCYSTQPVYFKCIPVSFYTVFPCTFLSLSHQEDTQGSQQPHPRSHWMHMAPIKVMFHQRSLFHLYSTLRLKKCSLSFGRVWIQDLIEALVTAIHEVSLCLPLLGSKKSPYVTITIILGWNQVESSLGMI